MKKLILRVIFLIVPLISFLGCQNTTNELSESEKDSIKEEVREVFDESIKAANAHDAAGMLAHDWNSQDYLYASNGNLMKGWNAKSDAVQSIHTNPELQSYGVVLDEVILRVISRQVVIITCTGHFSNFPKEQGPQDIKFVLTCLYEKINGKWVMTVGHESTHEQLF